MDPRVFWEGYLASRSGFRDDAWSPMLQSALGDVCDKDRSYMIDYLLTLVKERNDEWCVALDGIERWALMSMGSGILLRYLLSGVYSQSWLASTSGTLPWTRYGATLLRACWTQMLISSFPHSIGTSRFMRPWDSTSPPTSRTTMTALPS